MQVALVVALLVPVAAHGDDGRPALTRDEIRIDREIGDGNGWIDPLEQAVAHASYLVYRSTGMNIRPRLGYLPKYYGGYETRDAYGPRVFIARSERPETVMFTVFHEAGHVAYRHDLRRLSRNNELWADEYAGRLVASTRADLRAAIADYRTRGDRLHGTGDMRAAALVIGFLRNGGHLPPEIALRIRAITPSVHVREHRGHTRTSQRRVVHHVANRRTNWPR